MANPTRGFFGRGKAARDPRLPPGQYDAGDQWPVLNAEVTPHLDIASWSFSVEGLVDTARRPGPGRRSTLFLCPHIPVTFTASPPGPSSACSFSGVSVDTLLGIAGLEARPATCWRFRTPGTPPICRWPMSPAVEHGWSGTTRTRPCRSNMADPHASWSRTSTFGRVRNGWPGCECSITTNRVSGSATATTIGETRGSSSATRAIRK